jgi:hypothetical protein
MDKVVGSAVAYKNITWPADNNATLTLFLHTFASFAFGIPTSLFVLLVSFFSSKIEGNYKYFIANSAFFDLGYCTAQVFVLCFHLYHIYFNVPMNAVKCTILSFAPNTTGMCLCFAIPLTSVNRYFVIVKGKEKWFTKKLIVLICMTALFPILYPIKTFLFARYITICPYCQYSLYIPYSLDIFLIYIIFVSYTALIFCNYSIYRVLSQHVTSLSKFYNSTAEQIKNERSLLKAIVIQGVVPVFTALPAGVVFISVYLFGFGWGETTFTIFMFNDGTSLSLTDLCLLCFAFTPTIDALVVLFVVKQYRKACSAILKKIVSKLCWRKKTGQVSPTAQENNWTS